MSYSLLLFLLVIGACFCVAIFRFVYAFAKFWGLHFRRIDCPVCRKAVPFARKPTSARQELWGGWTCENCGAEMDEMGTDMSSLIKAAQEQDEAGFLSALKHDGGTPVERVIKERD
jgi:hypothetical protein